MVMVISHPQAWTAALHKAVLQKAVKTIASVEEAKTAKTAKTAETSPAAKTAIERAVPVAAVPVAAVPAWAAAIPSLCIRMTT